MSAQSDSPRSPDRASFVLAVLSTVPSAEFQPVHVQKLFFLIDKKLGGAIGGPYFDFKPYDYGPFDKAVYETLETLATGGLVEQLSKPGTNQKRYRLTHDGIQAGNKLRDSYPAQIGAAFLTLTEYVSKLSFTQLVSAVYKEYPEMRINSVFK